MSLYGWMDCVCVVFWCLVLCGDSGVQLVVKDPRKKQCLVLLVALDVDFKRWKASAAAGGPLENMGMPSIGGPHARANVDVCRCDPGLS